MFDFLVLLIEGVVVQGENLTHQYAFDDLTDHENPDCKNNQICLLNNHLTLNDNSQICILKGC